MAITMYNRDYSVRSREGLLEAVYDSLTRNSSLEAVHIPHSDVFYVREALEARFKRPLSLEQVEEYMRDIGWTDSQASAN